METYSQETQKNDFQFYDTQDNDVQHNIMLTVIYAECHMPFMLKVVMLNVIILSVMIVIVTMLSVLMLSVIMLSIIMLNVIMMCVVAPKYLPVHNDWEILFPKNVDEIDS